MHKYHPSAEVVISKEVASLGFVERENAAILNASFSDSQNRPSAHLSMRPSGSSSTDRSSRRKTTARSSRLPGSFGTFLRLPIRTFSDKENMLVVEMVVPPPRSECSSRAGALAKSPPKPKSSASARNFRVPMSKGSPRFPFTVAFSRIQNLPRSIGLGGGSIVRESSTTGKLTVGPDWVGHHLQTRALVSGGDARTSTDYAVAAQNISTIGDAARVPAFSSASLKVIDSTKTAHVNIPVLLVGGGALIAPDTLKGMSRVVQPKYSGEANAIGAAIARVSGTIDTAVSTADKTTQAVLEEVSQKAIDKAYIANKSRAIVKAIGDFDFSIPVTRTISSRRRNRSNGLLKSQIEPLAVDILAYRPTRMDRLCARPSSCMDPDELLHRRDRPRRNTISALYPTARDDAQRHVHTYALYRPKDSKDDALIARGGGKGSPTVGIKKLPANEQMEAVYEQLKRKPDAVIALEIGGENALQGMLIGASNNLNIPTIDDDWMGRPYPVSWQVTPSVLGGDKADFLPTAIADGNGNNTIPLKNENLAATILDANGNETVVATVADLICVCDGSSGEANGTPRYRYGLQVTVLGIQASERRTSTPRGSSGIDVDYKPSGVLQKPVSVIDEFAP
ncbi:DUF917-domain-containing protein [Mycena kentingensis (nom. inval.)]|nr:DUF917-domain-containing protein [Mycena kentingensis (nom. inval.)]